MLSLNFKYFIWLSFIVVVTLMNDTNANMIYIEDDKLYLVGSKKEDLIEVVNALRILASKLHEEVDLSEEIQVIEDSFQLEYETEITPYLTERIREMLLKSKVNYFGPNCWNAVLYFLKIVDNLRFVCEDEIKYYLTESGLFTEVNGCIEAGDVGAIYDSNKEIEHTFIYLIDKVILHKSGSSMDLKYEIIYFSNRGNAEIRYYRCLPYEDIQNLFNPLRYQRLPIDEITENITQLLETSNHFEIEIQDKKFLMQYALAYDRCITSLLRSNENNFFKKFILYSWKGAIFHLCKLLKYTYIECRIAEDISYKWIKSISLNNENKCILSWIDFEGLRQNIETCTSDLQKITLIKEI